MTIFKTSQEILSRWQDSLGTSVHPKKYEWLESRDPTPCDIKFWEEIYCESGNLGVYAAYSPFVEMYLIIHLSVLENELSQELFYGSYAEHEIIERCKDLGIVLPIRTICI